MCSDCCASPFFALTILRPPLLPTEARQAEAPSAATGPADVFGKRDACSDGGSSSSTPHPSPARQQKLSDALDIKFGERGQQRDPHKAVAMLEDLVKEISTDSVAAQALCELGDLHLSGIPSRLALRRDTAAAVRYFAASAALGYGPALHALGFAHATGVGGVQRNDKVATQLQLLGALTGYVPSLQSTAFRRRLPTLPYVSVALQQVAETVGEQQLRNPLIPLLPLPPSVRFSEHTKTERREQQNAQRQQDDVLQYWEAQAKNDDPVASYELAKLLEQQQQQEQQQSPADDARKRRVAELLQKAGESNMGAALRDLALAHLHGNGVPHDVGKAVDLLHKAAAAGDADAQNYIGYFYWVGTEEGLDGSSSSSSGQSGGGGSVLKKDPVKAEEYFSMAALQEHPEAFYFLGEIKQHQANEVKDEKEKSTAFKTAGEFGAGADSIRRALQLYYEKDYDGALLLSLAAAEEGIEVAQWNAGFLLRSKVATIPGGSVGAAHVTAADSQQKQQQTSPHMPPALLELMPSDGAEQQQEHQSQQQQGQHMSLVYRLFNRAALQGNVQALREIGLMHANGEEGATRDEGLALQVLMRALSLGDLQ
ncbi:protein sel-1 homolog 1 [Cyclospora cayetanensis]|uniref:Protein sel-1 homolog 1 n=1 Tax=Cyclospora cayetanensis TaxID=88456 RepID=A0A6P6RR37_9EIME|nr:protein sel-1 homolog 1 [Cyclospora cayetanensis]